MPTSRRDIGKSLSRTRNRWTISARSCCDGDDDVKVHDGRDISLEYRRMHMERYNKAVALWQSKKITTDAELAEALNGQSIAFAYNSGKLENEQITYHDTREIFERDGVSSYTGDLRTLFEIRNAKEAYEYFLLAFRDRHTFDESLVKELQRLLTQNTYDTRRYQLGERAGEYKRHDYVTGRGEVGAAPEDVAEEMAELLSEVQEISDEKILTAAAYFHAKFENIHPFADGNGRTGRLLMNYLLVTHNHPPVTIHEEDRKQYYAALEAWDTAQSLEELCEFLRQQTVKTWEKQIERAETKKR